MALILGKNSPQNWVHVEKIQTVLYVFKVQLC